MKPKLEIIVPHYKEPWDTGKKLFDILALQRGVEPGEFRVILCQDGEEGKLDGSLFDGLPFEVKQIRIPHRGVSAARNAGMAAAVADWIAFCDFDDMYTSVHSLKVALRAISAAAEAGKVFLWNNFLEEGKDRRTGAYVVYRHDWDMTFVHGRFYQRQFLIDNGLRFNEELSFGEDQDFNTVTQIVAGEDRVGTIKDPIYLWCSNENSVTRVYKDRSLLYPLMLKHRFATIDELERRGIDGEHLAAVVRTTVDIYYEMNGRDVPENVKKSRGMFLEWWKDHRLEFAGAPRSMVSGMLDKVRRNAVERRNEVIEEITLGQWLRDADLEIEREGR